MTKNQGTNMNKKELIGLILSSGKTDKSETYLKTRNLSALSVLAQELGIELPEPESADSNSESTDEKVYVYCCIHGGIRLTLSNGDYLHLKSANEISKFNKTYDIRLNPNKYSVKEIPISVMEDIKCRYKESKFLKNLFIFFAKTPTLTESQLKEVLAKRGDSPYEQLDDKRIAETGMKKFDSEAGDE